MLVGKAQAEDPNPDVAKAIQAIAARRAEKVEAQARQVAAWAKGEARGYGVVPLGRGAYSARLGDGAGGALGQVQVLFNEGEDND